MHKYEPLWNTYGVNFCSVGLLTALTGLYLSRDEINVPTKTNTAGFTRLWIRSIPGWSLMLFNGPSWNGFGIWVRLGLKFFVPGFWLNIYMFGYSNRFLEVTSASHRELVALKK